MSNKLRAYLQLSKLRIGTLVVITTALGYFAAPRHTPSFLVLFFTLFGTLLSCSGSAVLNNFLERDIDRLMPRTRKRALPSGEVTPSEALSLGVILVLTGVSLLVTQVNLLTGFLALLTCFLYVIVYTPLKRITWLNTMIGAIPGALPPMGGWAAATNSLDVGAWVLFAILFIWQQPHFYSIAWIFKEEYRAAGFKMLPAIEEDGARTFRQVFWFTVLLVPISLFPALVGTSGAFYSVGALVAGLGFLFYACAFIREKSTAGARMLLKASVLYLPLILFLIVTDVSFH